MCNLYSLTKGQAAIIALVRAMRDRTGNLPPMPGSFPTLWPQSRALGPMAKLIVRKAAAQTNDRAELCSILSDNIVDPETRRRFVDAFNKQGSSVRAGASGTSGARSSVASSPSSGSPVIPLSVR